ncbi:hypothetical protein HPB50_021091 [Hyalomma asiaticum]|uniref:Uncharacterized protein n=1 Tax=Hyalomma asiaticum TaxID=266040 RepID=A0ACB7TNI3_HYAAI|nr:hypothetical protein HPB50_021091 [Hyalomma asiaticum]
MSAGGEATLFPMTLTGFLPFSSHRVLWSLTLLLSCIVPVAVHIARRRRIAELISKIPGPTAAHPILGNLDVLYELKKEGNGTSLRCVLDLRCVLFLHFSERCQESRLCRPAELTSNAKRGGSPEVQ